MSTLWFKFPRYWTFVPNKFLNSFNKTIVSTTPFKTSFYFMNSINQLLMNLYILFITTHKRKKIKMKKHKFWKKWKLIRNKSKENLKKK